MTCWIQPTPIFLPSWSGSRESSGGILNQLDVGRTTYFGSIPGRGKRFSSFARLHWLLGPTNTLLNGQRGLFLWRKTAEE
jgi:hypothetical protein